MMEGSTLHRISVDELPDLLNRLSNEQTTDFVLLGHGITWLSEQPEYWPQELQGHVVYHLTNDLSGLPHELSELKRLQELTLLGISLKREDVAAIAKYLDQLTSLNLANNQIGVAGARAIAENFGKLTSLNLSRNQVGDAGAMVIAKSLGRLTSLKLSDNQVGDAGARVIAQNLGRLTSLDLWRNQIGDIGVRDIAENLGRLTSLVLWDNQVGDAGAIAIAKNLGQLTSLNLARNKVGDAGVKAIAENLGQITSLALWDNQVGDAGAKAISKNLEQSTYLNLSGNQVGNAGARAIAENLGQLTSLNLPSNQVGYAGARAIAENLSQLTSLNLSNNQVADAGARVIAENLGNLTSLNLSRNLIGDAGARSIAKNLGNLTSLNLSINGIGNEGVMAIAQHLPSLVTLELKSNKRITTVGPLAHLPLSKLNIANTGVADLSPLKSFIMAGLPAKWSTFSGSRPGIYLKDCPLTHPSSEVASQGPEAVLNFFREIDAQGVDQLFEAKLLIIGEGGAGKTSLLRRLFLPKMNLPVEEETTRGIDIHRHEFPIPNKRTFRLNTWDFGGQQIYHATHQFFLTRRSLYVLVDDTRSDHRSIHDEGFKFWLEVVETLSEGSPLLIFQNEKGGRSKQIDEAGIKGRFSNVQVVHRGNLEHRDAADSLRRAVEHFARDLPHIGDKVPAKWVAIRQDLKELAQSRPHIPLDEYFTVYERHLEPDHDKALHLSQYLHDLGVFLHFQQTPLLRRTVFLQNQWVTDAVFRILDDEEVKSKLGRFTLSDCDRLWTGRGYAEKDVELRELMVRFELCYRLPDTNGETWLVPQHLSPSKPEELADWAALGDLVLTYRYEFLPRGLVSRLMVRMHRYVKQPELCWSHGALFEHGETQVLVETTTRGNGITLRSRGPEKMSLLSVIAGDLDALNSSFHGLKDKVGKLVPCICNTCADMKEPAMFEQKELLDRKNRGKSTIECPKPPDYADVGVLALLDGMNLEEWLKRAGQDFSSDEGEPATPMATDQSEPEPGNEERDGNGNDVEIKTVRIFLASSSELLEDRDAFEFYFHRQNNRLRNQGLYLEIFRWELFIDAMSETRLQDEYNQKIRKCDVFVSLFKTKTGKYTEEEFEVAWQKFKTDGKPLIYTYFRNATVSTSEINLNDLISLRSFQKKLKELGHFHTEYDSTEELKRHFRDQLDKLKDGNLL